MVQIFVGLLIAVLIFAIAGQWYVSMRIRYMKDAYNTSLAEQYAIRELMYSKGKVDAEIKLSGIIQEVQPMQRRAQLDRDILAWSKRTFPESDSYGIMRHLLEEIEELGIAITSFMKSTGEVADCIADVYILLITLSDYYNIDLYLAVDSKHNINIGREWKYDEERGYHKHIIDGLMVPPDEPYEYTS